jgi:hypothetical protein
MKPVNEGGTSPYVCSGKNRRIDEPVKRSDKVSKVRPPVNWPGGFSMPVALLG